MSKNAKMTYEVNDAGASIFMDGGAQEILIGLCRLCYHYHEKLGEKDIDKEKFFELLSDGYDVAKLENDLERDAEDDSNGSMKELLNLLLELVKK